jgi:hypothetical protein
MYVLINHMNRTIFTFWYVTLIPPDCVLLKKGVRLLGEQRDGIFSYQKSAFWYILVYFGIFWQAWKWVFYDTVAF